MLLEDSDWISSARVKTFVRLSRQRTDRGKDLQRCALVSEGRNRTEDMPRSTFGVRLDREQARSRRTSMISCNRSRGLVGKLRLPPRSRRARELQFHRTPDDNPGAQTLADAKCRTETFRLQPESRRTRVRTPAWRYLKGRFRKNRSAAAAVPGGIRRRSPSAACVAAPVLSGTNPEKLLARFANRGWSIWTASSPTSPAPCSSRSMIWQVQAEVAVPRLRRPGADATVQPLVANVCTH